MATTLDAFLAAPIEHVDVGTEIAYRRFGQGPAIVLVHGWPLNGATYRGLVAILAQHYTCYVPDLPGSGSSPWDPRTREIFNDWGELVARFVDALGLSRVVLVGHDSGGALVRIAAARLGTRVALLVLIDTEIPGHTPAMIALYGVLLRLPGAQALFDKLIGYGWYRRSRLGFGACFRDPAHLDGDFHRACVEPLLSHPGGAIRTFLHFDPDQVHELGEVHREIQAPTVLIWGERDPFFPADKARVMSRDFADLRGFHLLRGESLFVQDEAPARVAEPLLPLLRQLHSSGGEAHEQASLS